LASKARVLENSATIMSPVPSLMARGNVVEKPTNMNELILEAWAQGLLVGSLVILSCITLANMRRGVLLHKVSANKNASKTNTDFS
jgi:hypothetical protein